jgi:hypothetical protein
MEDTKLKKKLVSIQMDDELNKKNSKMVMEH